MIRSKMIRMEGRWRAQLIDPATGEPVAEYRGKNLITNRGLDMLGERGIAWYRDVDSVLPYNVTAHVGTGAAEINADSVTLDGYAASTSNNNGKKTRIEQLGDGHYKLTYTRQFDKDDVDGLNLTRAGVSPGTIGNPPEMFSQWLFTDPDGNPVTITPSGQHLRLIWSLEFHVAPITPQAVTISIDGADHQAKYTLHNYGAQASRGRYPDLRTIDALLSGRIRTYETGLTNQAVNIDEYNAAISLSNFISPQEIEQPAYVAGARARTITFKWDTAHANQQIKALVFGAQYATRGAILQFDDGEELTKEDTKELSITLNVGW